MSKSIIMPTYPVEFFREAGSRGGKKSMSRLSHRARVLKGRAAAEARWRKTRRMGGMPRK